MKKILIEKFSKDETLRVTRGRGTAPLCNSFRIGGIDESIYYSYGFCGDAYK